MKASKFTGAQKAFILKQGADDHPVADICQLKQLEDENSKPPESNLT